MGGGGPSSDDELIAGINVTPLVDVTLVLLIIFIVTARIIVTQSLPMDLPKAATGSETQTVFSVELGSGGETVVDSKRVPAEDAILPLAREARAKNPELRAVIRADSAVQHGRVIRVMDLLKQAGVAKVAFGVSPTAAEVGAAPASSNLPSFLEAPDDTGRTRPPLHLVLDLVPRAARLALPGALGGPAAQHELPRGAGDPGDP